MTRPNVFSTPRIWFSISQRMRTSRVRVASPARTAWLASALMWTWRNQPVRTNWAMPAASLRSVLVSITFKPALACRASMQNTGSPSAGPGDEGRRNRFLTKPFRDQNLLDAIQLSLERDRAWLEEEKALTELRAASRP
jgi:hypothetical protein